MVPLIADTRSFLNPIISDLGIVLQLIVNALLLIRWRHERVTRNQGATSPPSRPRKRGSAFLVKLERYVRRHPATYILANAVLLAIFMSVLLLKPFGSPVAVIISPNSNQAVMENITVEGKYSHIDPYTQLLWVTVYDENEHKYFIQNSPAQLFANSQTWKSRNVEIGSPDSKGEQFEIQVLLVDTNSRIYRQIKSAVDSVSYQGQDLLPDGVILLTEITVTRN